MKIPRLAIVMGEIDDDLISAAETYHPRQQKWHPSTRLKRGVIAACICVAILVTIPLLSALTDLPAVDTTGEKVTFTFAEAQTYVPFYKYLPTVAADGYDPEEEVFVYGGAVMEVFYVNHEGGDTLTIRISPKTEYDTVETGKILYQDEGDSSSSYLYVDCGDYLVYYSSAECDLNEVEGFQEMVASSEYFAD